MFAGRSVIVFRVEVTEMGKKFLVSTFFIKFGYSATFYANTLQLLTLYTQIADNGIKKTNSSYLY